MLRFLQTKKSEVVMKTATGLLREAKQFAWDPDKDINWGQARTTDPLAEWEIIPAGLRVLAWWKKLPREVQIEVNRALVLWRIMLFAFGEAMTVRICKKLLGEPELVERARLLIAQQWEEEVRHVRVFHLYARYTFLNGGVHSCNEHLKALERLLCSQNAWYYKLLGMNILEALAHAAFTNLGEVVTDPLLKEVLQRVCRDEKRHVDFGEIELANVVSSLSPEERENLRAFVQDAITLAGGRHLPLPVFDALGEDKPPNDVRQEIERAYVSGGTRPDFEERLANGLQGLLEPLGLMPS